MKNYQCKKCATLLQSGKQPNNAGCPSGSFHQWSNLGDVGSTNYQCKKCAVLVQVNRQPSGAGCPEGSFHQWSRL